MQDLWLEARTKSRAPWYMRLLFSVLRLFFPNKAAAQKLLGADNNALICDLSSYNPGANVEELIDRGVSHFFLRMLYIGNYQQGDWRLSEDPTYRTYFARIRKHAKETGKKVWIGGYIIYCSGVEMESFERMTEYTDLAGQIVGTDFKPDLLIIDDEVDSWWRGTTKVTATPFNQVEGVKWLRLKLERKFKLPIMHYSARWFINKYKLHYETYYDNINRPESMGGVGKIFPVWYAWYPLSWSEVFTNPRDVIPKIITPTGVQESTLLSAPGSYTGWEAWQFTDRLVTPYYKDAAGRPAGLDFSISRQSLAQFNAAVGLLDQVVTPPPVDPPPPPVEPPSDLTEWQKAVEVRLGSLEETRNKIRAA